LLLLLLLLLLMMMMLSLLNLKYVTSISNTDAYKASK
jgi:hypothetical protein